MKPQFHVNIDSISSEEALTKKKYILLPGNKDANAEDLQFKEFANYIHRALIAKGFVPADNAESAEIAVFLAYGIGDPKEHQYSYSMPVWGQTGVSSSTTSGTLSTYGNYGSYSGTTTYTPTYGVTGYTSHVGSYITYFRFMSLDAYDLGIYRKQKKASQAWRTTVTSTGSSGDLRRVLPILVAGSKEYVGSNTGQKVQVILYEDDAEVLEIKNILLDQTKPKQ
jgi:hypothetical protein